MLRYMHRIPKNHPRYVSLVIRDRMVSGLERGLAVPQGLLAHGRGEAFDYLIGERTQPEARAAIRAAAASLLVAKRPVISVNGNAASLVAKEMVQLARAIPGAVLEVNLFHRTEKRAAKIASELKRSGAVNVLGPNPDSRLDGLTSPRGKCFRNGMFGADVVFVPLEDGDRATALKKAGKLVIAIDLNPLSRTARAAGITIVDNIVRALPALVKEARSLRKMARRKLERLARSFDNDANLKKAVERMLGRLRLLARGSRPLALGR